MEINSTRGADYSVTKTQRKHNDNQRTHIPPTTIKPGDKLKPLAGDTLQASGEKEPPKKESLGDICDQLTDAFDKLVDSIIGDPEAIQQKDEERILKRFEKSS